VARGIMVMVRSLSVCLSPNPPQSFFWGLEFGAPKIHSRVSNIVATRNDFLGHEWERVHNGHSGW
jgi:hypothetical protein